MLLSIAFVLTLVSAPEQTTAETAKLTVQPAQNAAPQSDMVDPLIVESLRKGKPVISDHAIEKQLNHLVKDQPDRMVCLRKTEFGTRIPRGYCGTLRQWYDLEASRGTQRTMARLRGPKGGYAPAGGMVGPPGELVSLIRARLQNPKYRALAQARAKARLEAEAAARTATPADQPI